MELFWNKLNAIGEEVHSNAVEIAVVKANLTNHLSYQDKKTNSKLIVFGIITAATVGLVTVII